MLQVGTSSLAQAAMCVCVVAEGGGGGTRDVSGKTIKTHVLIVFGGGP